PPLTKGGLGGGRSTKGVRAACVNRSRIALTVRLMGSLALLGISGPYARGADEGPLGLADLPAYQAALSGRSDRAEAPTAVEFRDLWDHPGTFQGRRVQVSGSIVRRFRQGAYGVFPPLDEVWIASPSGNPLCLVCPSQDTPGSKLGDRVRFVGTYLKRVQYQGGDVPRLAPLIVGAQPPALVMSAPASSARSPGGLSALDWTLGLIVTGLVVLVLGRQHLRRPERPRLDSQVLGPPPEFVRPGFEENRSAV
ncbi:MAG: hypothetical protein P4L84_07565, partial [Isosphaeraceae bacterium]|nr:hypothetical protein [Isosphaeraceae bacterium]